MRDIDRSEIERFPPAGFVIQRPYPKAKHYEIESILCDIGAGT